MNLQNKAITYALSVAVQFIYNVGCVVGFVGVIGLLSFGLTMLGNTLPWLYQALFWFCVAAVFPYTVYEVTKYFMYYFDEYEDDWEDDDYEE